MVTSIDSHMDAAIELLAHLHESGTNKSDANRIRMAVLSIHAANNIIHDVLGTDAGSINSTKQSVESSGEIPARDPGQDKPKSESNLDVVSAHQNLERLVYNVGPQRTGDIVTAGLATDPDQAMGLMSHLVQTHKASWTSIGEARAIVAVR